MLVAEPDAEAALRHLENRKLSEYAPPVGGDGQPLVPAVKVVPLAFDTYGRWGQGAADELKLWARRRLKKPDAAQSARTKGVYAEVLSRWRATASCTLQRGNFEVYADCVGFGVGDEQASGDLAGSPAQPCFVEYLTCSAAFGR